LAILRQTRQHIGVQPKKDLLNANLQEPIMFTTSKNSPITLENLESRQLLSASVPQTHHLSEASAAPASLIVSLTHDSVSPLSGLTLHGKENPVLDGLGSSRKTTRKTSSRKGRHTLGATTNEPAVDGNVTGWVNVSGDPLFAPGGPSPLDVRQGQADDCYFLSALAETAYQDPNQIEHLISEQANGTYDVDLYNGHNFVDENVDGYLPVNSSGGLEYAKLGQDNDTWVAIMEKAFTYFRNAAQSASYAAINFGWPSEALGDLGAVGIQNYNLAGMSDGDDLYNQVTNDLNNNLGVELGTNANSGPLVASHAYAVMSTYMDSAGNTYLLVRNPWGTDGPNANGYQWVSCDTLLPQLVVVTSATV
jgi:hypothetical protein